MKKIVLLVLVFGIFSKGIYADADTEITADEIDYYQLAEKYYEGKQVKRDFSRAAEYYKKAYEDGNEDSAARLCAIYFFETALNNGIGVDREAGIAAEMCAVAAENGDMHSQNNLGILYVMGVGVERDIKKAMEYFSASAKQGNTTAQHTFGVMSLGGAEIEQDCDAAIYWLNLAAQEHNYNALYMLGRLYFKGECVQQDYSKAFEFFTKASNPFNKKRSDNSVMTLYDNRGYAKAQDVLGAMYFFGYGTEVNPDMAFYWISKAAEQNQPNAIRNLAGFYENGVVVEKDLKKAEELRNKADELQSEVSASNLQKTENACTGYGRCDAEYYANGVAAEKDLKKAEELYNKIDELDSRINGSNPPATENACVGCVECEKEDEQ
jgi:TPR repeat protein